MQPYRGLSGGRDGSDQWVEQKVRVLGASLLCAELSVFLLCACTSSFHNEELV